MNRVGKILLYGLLALLALAAAFLPATVVFAAGPSNSGTTKISLATRQIKQMEIQEISISAQLTDGGKPVGNAPIEFDMAASFFGDRQVIIGTAQTDATGTATIIYQPSQDGTFNITAHFLGDGTLPHVEIARTFTYSGPVSPYVPESSGLTPVRKWITPAIYGGVALFWLLLLGVGYRVLTGIWQSGKEVRPKIR